MWDRSGGPPAKEGTHPAPGNAATQRADSHIGLHIDLSLTGRCHDPIVRQQMGALELGHGVSFHTVLPGNDTTTGQLLGDPKRLLTALQARGHQREGADPQQGAVELLSQGAGHDHRQPGAGESSRPGGHGKPLQRGPLTPRQQGIHPFNQAVGKTTAIVENGDTGYSAGILNGNPKTIGAAVQGQQQWRGGLSHSRSKEGHCGRASPGRSRLQRPGSASKLSQARTSHSTPVPPPGRSRTEI